MSSLKPAEASAMATRTKPSLGLCRRGGIPERFWRLVPPLHLGRPKLYDVQTQLILGFFFFYAPNPGVLSSEGIDWVLLAAPATSTINLRSSDLRAHSLRHAYAALILRSRQQLPGMGGYRNEVKVIFLFQREQPKNNTKTPWGRLGGKKS